MSAAPNTITHPWWTKRVREHDNNKHNNLETNDNATNTDVSYFPARSGSISSIYSSESDTSFISFSELEWSTSDPKKEITTYPTSETSRSTTFEEKLQVEGVVLPAGLLIPLSKVRAVAVTIILAGGVFLHVSCDAYVPGSAFLLPKDRFLLSKAHMHIYVLTSPSNNRVSLNKPFSSSSL